MEEYEAQELEFWRKLEEMDMSRSQMLKRSFAAAAGLTILSSPAAALAGTRRGAATPPLKGKSVSVKELVAEAKKEGKLNTIALPPDWANYGEIMSTFSKKYGIPIANEIPTSTTSGARLSPLSERIASFSCAELPSGLSFVIPIPYLRGKLWSASL